MPVFAASVALATYALVWVGSAALVWDAIQLVRSRSHRLFVIGCVTVMATVLTTVAWFGDIMGGSGIWIFPSLALALTVSGLAVSYLAWRLIVRNRNLTWTSRILLLLGIGIISILAFRPIPQDDFGRFGEANEKVAAQKAIELASFAVDDSRPGSILVRGLRVESVSELSISSCRSGELPYEVVVGLYTVYGLRGQDIRVRCGSSYEFI